MVMIKNSEYKKAQLAVALFFFFQGTIFATWASNIPYIKSIHNLSDAALGAILFTIPIGQVCTMALAGWLTSRLGSKQTLRIGALLSPLSLIPIAIAPNITTLCISLLLMGIASNIFNISVNTQGVNIEQKYKKNIMPTLHGMWSLGNFFGALISLIFGFYSINTLHHFIIINIFVIILATIFQQYLVNEDFSSKKEKNAIKSGSLFKRIDKYILLLGTMACLALITEGTMYDWGGIYFSEIVKTPESQIKLGYIVCMCAMTIGRFTANIIINRYGNTFVLQLSGALITIGMIIAVISPTIIFATIGFGIVGFGIASTVPICYSLAGKSTSLSPAFALSTVSTLGYLGLLAGPPIIGFISEAITLRWTFGFVAIIGIVIAVIPAYTKDDF